MSQDDSGPTPLPASLDQAMLQKLQSLNTVGTISYVLHLIVAVGALIPGGAVGAGAADCCAHSGPAEAA
jgi:hypothetical protein